jgi:hypothetical protein
MEHRLSLRNPLTINVVIYFNGLGLLQGRSIDVSRHGMLVDTGPMTLPLHAMVDVAFPLDPGKFSSPPQRTPAMVVRLANEGVGLMFANEITAGKIFFTSRGGDGQNRHHFTDNGIG